jgi:dipeptidyl aminopeptidase/acylaminoacyl peptidase
VETIDSEVNLIGNSRVWLLGVLLTEDIKQPRLDYALSFKNVVDAQIAPNGTEVVFVVADFWKDDTKYPKSSIWIAHTNGIETRPFTSGPRTDKMPRWSPDGQRIAFLSDRVEDGKFQIYMVPREGGEAQALVKTKGSVNDLAWSPDGTCIAYLMQDSEGDEEMEGKEQKDDPIVFEKKPRFGRVWVVNVKSNENRLVTEGNVNVWEFSWSPDGEHLALLVSDEPYEWSWYVARVAIVAAKGGEPRTIFDNKPRQLALPRFAHDGKRIAFLSCIWSDRGTVGGDLWIIDLDGSNPRNLTKGWSCSISYFEWIPDDSGLICVGIEDAAAAIVKVDCDGQEKRLWSGSVAFAASDWSSFSISRDQKTIAVSREDLYHPMEIWTATLNQAVVSWKQLTHLNHEPNPNILGETESVRWKATDGLDLQGFLIRPSGAEKDKRYPLITVVHGGPGWLFGYRFQFPGYNYLYAMLPTRGYAVFLPNPRGSLGRGAAFTELNVGDMGGKDFQDVMAGIDHLIEQGIADPNRLGISGGSYGGFMTSWSVTQTERFSAAVECWGIVNWLSFHGTSCLAKWDEIAYNADPYEVDGVYRKFSPLTYVQRVKTPTLILHGELDPIVPVSQGYEFFRGLKDNMVEAELVIYPREGHGPLLEKKHLDDATRRIIDWFERHIPAGTA